MQSDAQDSSRCRLIGRGRAGRVNRGLRANGTGKRTTSSSRTRSRAAVHIALNCRTSSGNWARPTRRSSRSRSAARRARESPARRRSSSSRTETKSCGRSNNPSMAQVRMDTCRPRGAACGEFGRACRWWRAVYPGEGLQAGVAGTSLAKRSNGQSAPALRDSNRGSTFPQAGPTGAQGPRGSEGLDGPAGPDGQRSPRRDRPGRPGGCGRDFRRQLEPMALGARSMEPTAPTARRAPPVQRAPRELTAPRARRRSGRSRRTRFTRRSRRGSGLRHRAAERLDRARPLSQPDGRPPCGRPLLPHAGRRNQSLHHIGRCDGRPRSHLGPARHGIRRRRQLGCDLPIGLDRGSHQGPDRERRRIHGRRSLTAGRRRG